MGRKNETKKEEKFRFAFTGCHHSDPVPDRWGRIRCDLCGKSHKHIVGIVLYDFEICPACILAGPATIATEAKRIGMDKDRLERVWGRSMDTEARVNMSSAYRSLAKVLRGLGSFEDLPGGTVALGVAAAMQTSATRRKRKAA